MNTETFNPSNEATAEATNEPTTAPIDSVWSRLVPGPTNAATATAVPLIDLGDEDDSADETPGDESPIAGRQKSNAALKKTIGKRMAAARELNGLGQTEAARLIGWKNATQLSLIEQGKRMPPHQVLIIASTVLGISVDFLIGVDDEPERDGRAAAKKSQVRQIADLLRRNSEAVTEALFESCRFDPTQSFKDTKIVPKVRAFCEAFDRFREVNRSFDKSKCSATLAYAADEASEAIEQVSNLIDQQHRRVEFALRHGRAALAGAGGAA